MVVDSILPHAECEPNDHRKDVPPFMGGSIFLIMGNCKIDSENADRIFASTLKSVVIDGFQ